MGYRSEIIFVIDKKKYLEDSLLSGKFPEIFEESFDKEVRDDVVIFTHDYIKWCSWLYEDVAKAEEYLHSLDSEIFGFMRMGEDFEDVEDIGSPYDYGIYVERTLKIDL